jgi:hypothetical protein
MTGPLRNITEAAEWLGISPKTLQDWVSARRVPFTTLASRTADGRPATRLVRFAQHHLDAIVAAGEQQPIQTHAAAVAIAPPGMPPPTPPPPAPRPPAGPSTPPPPAGPKVRAA